MPAGGPFATHTLTSSQFTDNRASVRGGAVVSAADVTLDGLQFVGNEVRNHGVLAGRGGAWSVVGQTVTHSTAMGAASSVFTSNRARQGGAIGVDAGTLILDARSLTNPIRFDANEVDESTYGGGAVFIGQLASTEITDAEFLGNRSLAPGSFGGAVILRNGGTHIRESLFADNVAIDGTGGAIHIQHVDPTGAASSIEDCHFVGNGLDSGSVSTTRGGAVAIEGSQVDFLWQDGMSEAGGQPTGFVDNGATQEGGAVHIADVSLVQLFAHRFDLNQAVRGGAVAIRDSTVSFIDGRMLGNLSTEDGGAVWASSTLSGDRLTLHDVHVTDNTSGGNGGGVWIRDLELALSGDVRHVGNEATGSGGGLYLDGGEATVEGTFRDNLAQQNGGAIALAGGSLSRPTSPSSLQFTSNTAAQNGGALHLASATASESNVGRARFEANEAMTGSGGAIAVRTGRLLLGGGSELQANIASLGGGALWLDDAEANLGSDVADPVQIRGNRVTSTAATTSAPGILVEGTSRLRMDRVSFEDNLYPSGSTSVRGHAVHVDTDASQPHAWTGVVSRFAPSGATVFGIERGRVDCVGCTVDVNAGIGFRLFSDDADLRVQDGVIEDLSSAGGYAFQMSGTSATPEGFLAVCNTQRLDTQADVLLPPTDPDFNGADFRCRSTGCTSIGAFCPL